MALNLPPKQEDAAFAAWLLELLRETQLMEERIRELEREVRDLRELS